MKKILALALFVFVSTQMIAQTTKKSTKPAVKAPTKCQIYLESKGMSKVTVQQAGAWADSLPLLVKGDNGKIYKMHSFEIGVIQKEPFLNQSYGVGMDGIPILARRAIDKMKEGDSVFFSKVTYVDENGIDQKLPSVIFSIIAGAAETK